MNINAICFVNNDFFLCSYKYDLYAHQLFSLSYGHYLIQKKFFADMYLETWNDLYTPIAMWHVPLWFAQFGLRIGGGTQLLSVPI